MITAAKEAQEAAQTQKLVNLRPTDTSGYGLGALVDDFSISLPLPTRKILHPPADLAAARTAAQNKVDFVKTSVKQVSPPLTILLRVFLRYTLSLENTQSFLRGNETRREEVSS